jgi:hypothetical protein
MPRRSGREASSQVLIGSTKSMPDAFMERVATTPVTISRTYWPKTVQSFLYRPPCCRAVTTCLATSCKEGQEGEGIVVPSRPGFDCLFRRGKSVPISWRTKNVPRLDNWNVLGAVVAPVGRSDRASTAQQARCCQSNAWSSRTIWLLVLTYPPESLIVIRRKICAPCPLSYSKTWTFDPSKPAR